MNQSCLSFFGVPVDQTSKQNKARYDTFVFIHVWDIYDTLVAWRMHMCTMNHAHVYHNSMTKLIETHVTQIIRMSHVTRMSQWHDSRMCVTWLTRDMTHAWHNSRVTWFIYNVCHGLLTWVTWWMSSVSRFFHMPVDQTSEQNKVQHETFNHVHAFDRHMWEMNHDRQMTQIIQFNRVTRKDSLFLSFSCRQVGHTREQKKKRNQTFVPIHV